MTSEVIKKFLGVFFLSFFTNCVVAQNSKVLLVDSVSLEKISNEKISYKDIEVWSNYEGLIELPNNVLGDTLNLSALGYRVKDFIYKKRSDTIYLSPRESRVVDIQLYKKKNISNWACNGQNIGGFAHLIELEDRFALAQLKEVSLLLRARSKNSKKIKLNLYEVDQQNGRLGKPLLPHPIIITVRKNRKKLKLNLNEYKIPFPSGPFFLSIEFANTNFGDGDSMICLGLGSENKYSDTWIRKSAEHNWRHYNARDFKRRRLNLWVNLKIEQFVE